MNTITKNIVLFPFNLLYKISPEMDLKVLFRIKQGYPLNLKHPVTFNEKLQWIKLHDHNPLMTKCCDKYLVRRFVKDQGCGEILNKLIWSGYDPEEIPFEILPEKYVIKVTHGSTFNILVKDGKHADRRKIIKKCKKWLKAKFLPCYGEWFYGKEKPRIIVEEYLETDDGKDLKDYKVFCFNGEPAYVRVDSDRFQNHKSDIFDIEWRRIKNVHTRYPCSNDNITKPDCIKELLTYAKKLSEPFLHARIDFYIIKNKIYFGEITFTNGAGFDRFSSYEWDKEMGDKLRLRKVRYS